MCVTIQIVNKAAFKIENPISKEDALKLHPMSLAFIGDSVHALYSRTLVTIGSVKKTGALHKEVTKVVKAVSQSAAADKAAPLFNEDEADLFRRARNCHIQTSAKHADPCEYRKASGFEAVLGFLYLVGNTERLGLFLEISADGESKK